MFMSLLASRVVVLLLELFTEHGAGTLITAE